MNDTEINRVKRNNAKINETEIIYPKKRPGVKMSCSKMNKPKMKGAIMRAKVNNARMNEKRNGEGAMKRRRR